MPNTSDNTNTPQASNNRPQENTPRQPWLFEYTPTKPRPTGQAFFDGNKAKPVERVKRDDKKIKDTDLPYARL